MGNGPTIRDWRDEMIAKQREEIRFLRRMVAVKGYVPPHDLDAEGAVLSACLLDNRVIDLVLELLTPELFYSDANGTVYRAIQALAIAGQPVDIVTVATYLRAEDRIAQIGGPSYLAQLADATPAVAHVVKHARDVAELGYRRLLIRTLQACWANGYLETGRKDPKYREAVGEAVMECVTAGAGMSSGMTMREAMKLAMDQVAVLANRPAGEVTGLPTGYLGLDKATGGLHGREVVLVTAEEKGGKSSLVRSIAVNVAKRPLLRQIPLIDTTGQTTLQEYAEPQGVVYFTLEMDEELVALVVACSYAHVSFKKMRRGECTPQEIARVHAAGRWIESLPIRLVGDRKLTALKMRGLLRTFQAEFEREGVRLALAIVDTIQLMALAEPRLPGENEETRVNKVGKAIGDCAYDFGIPFLAVSQLNNDGTTWGSRSLQMHAQAKWRIWLDKKDKQDKLDPKYARIDVPLSRFGEDQCPLYWYSAWTLFSEQGNLNPSDIEDGS